MKEAVAGEQLRILRPGVASERSICDMSLGVDQGRPNDNAAVIDGGLPFQLGSLNGGIQGVGVAIKEMDRCSWKSPRLRR